MILNAIRMGEGPKLTILHGLFGAASNWSRVQRGLADTHHVIALDLRNHGASPHDPAITYPLMAADILDTLDAEHIGPTALLGHSMGGKVAMQLALTHPARVTRLIVADIAPVAYPPHFRTMIDAMLAIPLTPGLTRAAAHAALEAAAPDAAVRAFLLQNLRFTDPPAWRIALRDIRDALPTIGGWPGTGLYPGPTLILRGETSTYIQPEHRPLFRALFPAARFATLRGAGHWLHAEAPEAFIATVRAFLGAKPTA